jgi:hypothetical protein
VISLIEVRHDFAINPIVPPGDFDFQ